MYSIEHPPLFANPHVMTATGTAVGVDFRQYAALSGCDLNTATCPTKLWPMITFCTVLFNGYIDLGKYLWIVVKFCYVRLNIRPKYYVVMIEV